MLLLRLALVLSLLLSSTTGQQVASTQRFTSSFHPLGLSFDPYGGLWGGAGYIAPGGYGTCFALYAINGTGWATQRLTVACPYTSYGATSVPALVASLDLNYTNSPTSYVASLYSSMAIGWVQFDVTVNGTATPRLFSTGLYPHYTFFPDWIDSTLNNFATDSRLGYVYLVSTASNTVGQFRPAPTMTQRLVITGSNPNLWRPTAVAVDLSSLVYVSDGGNRLVQFNSQGVQLQVIMGPDSGFATTSMLLYDPVADGLLGIDGSGEGLRRYSLTGQVCGLLKCFNSTCAIGAVAFQPGTGDIFASDVNNNVLYRWLSNKPNEQNCSSPTLGQGATDGSSNDASWVELRHFVVLLVVVTTILVV